MTAALVADVGGRLVDEPGVYDMPEADYHRDPVRHLGGSASSTILRAMLPPSCPALARHKALHPKSRDFYDLGSVTHGLTLGRGCEIREVPAKDWTAAGKEGRAYRDRARAEGAVALLTKELAAARAMRDAVHAVPLAHALLTLPGAPERVLIWQEDVEGEPVWCRAMFDRWPDPDQDGVPTVVDLKTTAKGLDARSLQSTIHGFGYHLQEDFYRRGYRAVHGVWPDFVFVFAHVDEPHLVRCPSPDDALRTVARLQIDEALRSWVACRRSGVWPGYPNNEITLIGPPRWARDREDYA